VPLHIEEILLGMPSDAKQRITTIVGVYRDRIRDAVKDAVLLSLGGRGRSRHSIRITIPDRTPKIVSEIPLYDELGAALTDHREAFETSAECMALLTVIPTRLIRELRDVYLSECPSETAEEVRRFLGGMVARIDRANVVQRIGEIDGDFLGARQARSDDRSSRLLCSAACF